MNTELKNGMYVYTDYVPEDCNYLTVGRLYPVRNVEKNKRCRYTFSIYDNVNSHLPCAFSESSYLDNRSWKIATPEMVEAYFAGQKEVETIDQAAKKATEKYVNEKEKQTAYLEFIAGAKSDAAIKSEAAKKYWYEQFKT